MVRTTAVVLVVILLIGAGCAGNRQPDPITATATPVSVTDTALSQSGFEHRSTDTPRFTTSGQTTIAGDVQMTLRYRFNATTYRAVYQGGQPPAAGPQVYALWSVPLIEPEDVALSVDPLRNLATPALVTRVQDRYSTIANVEPASAGNLSARFLGSAVTVRRFDATAEHDGSTTEIVVYVAQTRHDGEVVTAVGVAPRGALEPATVRTLITGTSRK